MVPGVLEEVPVALKKVVVLLGEFLPVFNVAGVLRCEDTVLQSHRFDSLYLMYFSVVDPGGGCRDPGGVLEGVVGP